jgi:acetate kinase
MKVLVLNSGSSTLKFDLIDVYAAANGDRNAIRLARGLVDRIGYGAEPGKGATLQFNMVSAASDASEQQGQRGTVIRDHRDAVLEVFTWLDMALAGGTKTGGESATHIEAVGHRVVHGGGRFRAPVLIDNSVLAALEEINELAPLHNPPAITCIRAAREALGTSVPMVAVFDTAFHATLPDYAYTYALPRELAERNRIRRYGFHGIAHEYMLKRYVEMTGIPMGEASIITLQLGNGCSAAAVQNGRSVDTSMGFTPLEGLVMGTRSGDIDPGIIGYLAQREEVDAAEIEHWLNRRSGLLGISGSSSDMRDLLQAEGHDARARLAVEVFCYRARKYVGAYLAVLGGARAIVFGGGIGEHAPAVRARICEGMEWCGLRLDPELNASAVGTEGRISTDDAQIAAYVVSVDESVLIAQYTADYVLQH